LVDYIVFIVYKIFRFIVLILPKSLMRQFLDGLSYLIYSFNKEHKRYAKANLDLVYGDSIDEIRKQKIIRESYRNLTYGLYEFIENPTLGLEQLEKKVSVENEEVLIQAIEEGRKIILVSAHYGNWEYITSYISLKYKPTTMVGRKMNNKYLNDDMQKARNNHNSQMLYKEGSAKGLMKALKGGRIIGLATDQHITPSKGVEIEFLGHKAIQVDSSSRLAVKFDAVIIPVFFMMNRFRDYTIKFYPSIEPKEYEGENQIKDITQKEADIMSEQIRAKPELWFWQHRRFKQFHKEIYDD
jgi:KDO2-lipid IV(A) lauroyltransferase